MRKKIVKHFEGDSSTVTWDSQLCIHVAECGKAKGELFDMSRKPWCDPNVASDEEILDVVNRCLSGSLSVVFKDASLNEKSPVENTITVVYGGPLMIRGELEIEDAPEDAPGLNFRAALCRYGLSKNKPFCDGAHRGSKWRSNQ